MSQRPPPRTGLLQQPLNVLVRDYPELLALLRRSGVDIAARGADTLAQIATPELLDAVDQALAWRV